VSEEEETWDSFSPLREIDLRAGAGNRSALQEAEFGRKKNNLINPAT